MSTNPAGFSCIRSELSVNPNKFQTRVLFAIGIAVAVGVVAHANYSHQSPTGMSDFDQVWIAANALRHGKDPYAAVNASGWPFPLYYPLTAAIVAMPYSMLPIHWARVAFIATGAGLLAWALGSLPHRRWAILSGAFLVAFLHVQWSPFITGSVALPAFLAGVFLSAKPTIGLALAVAYLLPISRRTFWATLGALMTFLASLALRPSWPREFLTYATQAPHIIAPVTLFPLGPLMLLAILRWKRSEARLLAAMAFVPHTILAYEAIPLFLVPRTRKETLLLVLLADAVFALEFALGPLQHPDPISLARRVRVSGQIILALLYVPCLVMVLRRPNVAAEPTFIPALGPD